MNKRYDYIIVGAGSAGCVVAERLSRDPSKTVLLLEAGGKNNNMLLSVPLAAAAILTNKKFSWCYNTEPEKNLNNRSISWPRGKTLGGSSSINGMIYIRGQREDYDNWAALGNRGWSYDELLPYFIRNENNNDLSGPYHGNSGAQWVSNIAHEFEMSDTFIEAATDSGIPLNNDFNGASQEGVGYFQAMIKNGRRQSSATDYLSLCKKRKNFILITKALTGKIIVDNGEAIGVQYQHRKQQIIAYCNHEVVLCGGAINSPQLLELSGIGDSTRLKKIGIDLNHHLPGVGENLQDHLTTNVCQSMTKGKTFYDEMRPLSFTKNIFRYFFRSAGLMSLPAAQVGIFMKTDDALKSPDAQVHFAAAAGSLNDDGDMVPVPGVTASVCILRPTSRGSVHSTSKDPNQHPAIIANYLDTQHDMDSMLAALKKTRALFHSPLFNKFGCHEETPGKAIQSDEGLIEYLRQHSVTVYHPVGTCKMGCDSMAVVDDRLRVHGIKNLRVADGSIMPSLISGNTHSCCVVVGDKCADMIIEDQNLLSTAAIDSSLVDLTQISMPDLLNLQRQAFIKEGHVSYKTRIDRIDRCIALLVDNQDVLCEAINSDFGCRDPLVTQMSDLLTSIAALKNVKKNLKHWMKTERRKSPFPMNIIGGRSSVHYQPKGVVGITSHWNVPVNVIFSPLADVLGAGNRAMIKPSEFTPATSNLVAKLISQYFDSSEISVVKGDGAVGAEFSALPFDHLMFTGSSAIGKLVMAEAAKNLTPVTLELGGKSPVIVSDSADLADCIEKLVAGKTLNAGQVCITADYCYIPDALLDDFVSGIKDVYSTYFSRCLDNDDYVSIINKRHFDRLSDYLRDAENRGGHVINLGNPKEDWLNSDKLKIPLHLVVNPTDNMLVMQEELFGPILCIKTYNDLNTCITEINHRPRPLALYYFGKDKAEQQHVIDNSISGNVTINDIAVHFACDDIPFGGIGESGMGQLHGREGFKTFSHAKGVFKQGFIHLAKAAGTLPPFSDKARKMIAGVIKK